MSVYPNSTRGEKNHRSDLLRAALWYAERGYPVFPLQWIDETGRCSCGGRAGCKPGKHPRIANGHKGAGTDPGRIRRWWSRWPDANIGIPTGKRGGILALDVDQPAGLDELEAEHGKLTATRTHSTGSGGMHYLYRYPTGAEIRNSAGKLAPGIDVRGEGGYIIVPPSRTTRPYEVLDDLPLADTPAWLIEAGRRPRSAASDATGNRPRTITTTSADLDGPTIPAGTRDDRLTRIAGRLHDGSRDLDGLTAPLLEINARRCRPPLPDGQVEKIARSIHARTPCGKAATASAETREALDGIEARLWRIGWRGMGELSARDVYVVLIEAGRSHGELIPAGVRVSISVRALALAAAVSKRTAHYALKRLKSAGVVRADNGKRAGTQSGALVLLSDALVGRADLHHSPTRGRRVSSGASLRAPRLRWSAPEIRRLGKSCGAVLDALDRRGGIATLSELADDLHKTRTRDLRRRVVARLEAAAVVECSGDTVTLARDWIDALNIEREAAGEIDAHRRDMARFYRERVAFKYRREHRPDPASLPKRRSAGVAPIQHDLSGWVEEPAPALAPDSLPVGVLYDSQARRDPVRVPAGTGVLWQVFSDRAGVILDRDPSRVVFVHPREIELSEVGA